MKKTLAIFLALIMILSVALVACKSKTTSSNTNEEEESNEFVVQNKNDTSDTSDGTDDETGKTGVWVAANYTIYAMGNGVNIRAEANTGATKLGSVNIGDSLTATETDGKWYKINYNNATAYINALYVTDKQNEATFETCEDTVLKVDDIVVNDKATNDSDKYAKVMLRTDPTVADETATKHVLIYSDTANGELVKVGQNKLGNWYKVTYKGATYYIGSAAFKYFEGYTGSNGGLG